jgi:hypothetical protein
MKDFISDTWGDKTRLVVIANLGIVSLPWREAVQPEIEPAKLYDSHLSTMLIY